MNALTGESRQEDKFKRRLQRIVKEADLTMQLDLIQRISTELGIDFATCAAAVVALYQPNLYPQLKPAPLIAPLQAPGLSVTAEYKMVRYRLAVGNQHQVSRDDIQGVLVAESGVDKKCIGRIDIRDTHTLVELPDGMPSDIFQLLTEASIGPHRLHIKRVKPNKLRQMRQHPLQQENG